MKRNSQQAQQGQQEQQLGDEQQQREPARDERANNSISLDMPDAREVFAAIASRHEQFGENIVDNDDNEIGPRDSASQIGSSPGSHFGLNGGGGGSFRRDPLPRGGGAGGAGSSSSAASIMGPLMMIKDLKKELEEKQAILLAELKDSGNNASSLIVTKPFKGSLILFNDQRSLSLFDDILEFSITASVPIEHTLEHFIPSTSSSDKQGSASKEADWTFSSLVFALVCIIYQKPLDSALVYMTSSVEDLKEKAGDKKKKKSGWTSGIKKWDDDMIAKLKKKTHPIHHALGNLSISIVRTKHIRQLLRQGMILVLSISQFHPQERVLEIVTPFDALAREAERCEEWYPLTAKAIKRIIPGLNKVVDLEAVKENPAWWKRLIFLGSHIPTLHPIHHSSHLSVTKRSGIFRFEDLNDFMGGDKDPIDVVRAFFSPAKRNLLCNSIVSQSVISISGMNTATIWQLLTVGVYKDYFALHGGSAHPADHEIGADGQETIRLLLKVWAESWKPSHTPIGVIRTYMGEMMGFYFAFLDFYTSWTLFPGFLGLLAFSYGLYYSIINNGTWIQVFDNNATAFFALLLSIWSLLFLKYWKRRTAYLSFIWDMDRFSKESHVRAAWKASEKRISEVTGREELYEPGSLRHMRRLKGRIIIGVAILGLAVFVGSVVFLEGYFNSLWGTTAGSIAATSVGLLQIFLIMPWGDKLALWTNDSENYRNSIDYTDHLVWKIYLLAFINSYGLLFFSGLVKPVIYTVAPDFLYFSRYTFQCNISPNGENSCLTDLVTSVLIIFGLKQFASQALEVGLAWWARRSMIKTRQTQDHLRHKEVSKESELSNLTPIGMLYEYETPVIQLGNVLLFSCAFQLAPILAYFSNVIQLKTDMAKFVLFYKRPFAENARDIGSWNLIITSVVHLGLLTNAIILAFTSNGLENLLFTRVHGSQDYQMFTKICYILLFENALLVLGALINFMIPDVPRAVQIGRESEMYLEGCRFKINQSNFDGLDQAKTEADDV